MAILQQFLAEQNLGKKNEKGDASRPASSTITSHSAASAPSFFETTLFETNEDELVEQLINEVKMYRSLWDPQARAYKELPKKNDGQDGKSALLLL